MENNKQTNKLKIMRWQKAQPQEKQQQKPPSRPPAPQQQQKATSSSKFFSGRDMERPVPNLFRRLPSSVNHGRVVVPKTPAPPNQLRTAAFLGHNETAEVFSHQILSKINDENP